MLKFNYYLANSYRVLANGLLTSQEFFTYFWGMIIGLELAGNDMSMQRQVLEDLKHEYENTPYSRGRDITVKEQEILDRLKEV